MRRPTLTDLALLGLLEDRDLHGYELKKQLGELVGGWSPVSFGSLYPALARLESAGAVRVVEDGATLTMPMTGALSGEVAAFRSRRRTSRDRRGKKVYAITPQGRERLTEMLVSPDEDDDRRFAVKVAFCRHLRPEQRLALFERRRRHLQERADRRPTPASGDRYLRSLRERDTRNLDIEIHWLDQLIDDERAAIDTSSRPPTDLDRGQPVATAPAPPIQLSTIHLQEDTES